MVNILCNLPLEGIATFKSLSSWFFNICMGLSMWLCLVGDSPKLGSLFWAGCFKRSLFYALHILKNKDT